MPSIMTPVQARFSSAVTRLLIVEIDRKFVGGNVDFRYLNIEFSLNGKHKPAKSDQPHEDHRLNEQVD
jgi:hypothetical protein